MFFADLFSCLGHSRIIFILFIYHKTEARIFYFLDLMISGVGLNLMNASARAGTYSTVSIFYRGVPGMFADLWFYRKEKLHTHIISDLHLYAFSYCDLLHLIPLIYLICWFNWRWWGGDFNLWLVFFEVLLVVKKLLGFLSSFIGVEESFKIWTYM